MELDSLRGVPKTSLWRLRMRSYSQDAYDHRSKEQRSAKLERIKTGQLERSNKKKRHEKIKKDIWKKKKSCSKGFWVLGDWEKRQDSSIDF